MNSNEFCGGDAGNRAGRWGKNSVDRRSVGRLAALLLLLVAVIAGCAGQPAEPVTGTLVLGAAGLPEGAEATATISGPAELNTTVQLPGSIALQAGDYTVSAHDLTHGSVRYVAAPTASQVTVAAGQDRTVTFTYAAEETGPGPQDPGAEDPGGEDPGGEDPGDDDSEDDDDEQIGRASCRERVEVTDVAAAGSEQRRDEMDRSCTVDEKQTERPTVDAA